MSVSATSGYQLFIKSQLDVNHYWTLDDYSTSAEGAVSLTKSYTPAVGSLALKRVINTSNSADWATTVSLIPHDSNLGYAVRCADTGGNGGHFQISLSAEAVIKAVTGLYHIPGASSDMPFFLLANQTASYVSVYLDITTNCIKMVGVDGGGFNVPFLTPDTSASISVVPGSAYHFVWRDEGDGNTAMFLDGSLVGRVAHSLLFGSAARLLTIGTANPALNTNRYSGRIDEVALFGSLNSSQAVALYSAATSGFSATASSTTTTTATSTIGSSGVIVSFDTLPYYPQLMAENYNKWQIRRELQRISDTFRFGGRANNSFASQYSSLVATDTINSNRDTENLLINGGFEISQRYNMDVTHTATGNALGYKMDHWFFDATATAGAKGAFLALENALYNQGSLSCTHNTYARAQRVLRISQNASRWALSQAIEGAVPRYVSYSLDMLLNDSASTTFTFRMAFIRRGVGGGAESTNTWTAENFAVAADDNWHHISSSLLETTTSEGWVFMGSQTRTRNETCVIAKLSVVSPVPGGSTNYHKVTGLTVNAGPSRYYVGRDLGLELQRCQRYYEKSYDSYLFPGDASATPGCTFVRAGNFNSLSGNILEYYEKCQVRKRPAFYGVAGNPSVILYSPLNGTANRALDQQAATEYSATNNYAWTNETGFRVAPQNSATSQAVYLWQWVYDAEYSMTSLARAI